MKCWGHGEEHLLSNCPHKHENARTLHNAQDATTIIVVVRSIPRIYASLEDRQTDHQSSMVEVEGKIAKQFVSVLIDLVLVKVTFP